MVLSVQPPHAGVARIARLFEHLAWADAELAGAMRAPNAPSEGIREFAHIAAAEELWLSRIEQRPSKTAVWPELGAAEAASLAAATGAAFRRLIATLTDATVDAPVNYTNSAGKSFTTALGDILLHVAMHGQYHRGKVNLLLRQAGLEPAPTDFISFVRGSPAATQATARR